MSLAECNYSTYGKKRSLKGQTSSAISILRLKQAMYTNFLDLKGAVVTTELRELRELRRELLKCVATHW